MRHRVYGKRLGRNKDERDRLFKNLAVSLFTYGTIETSESKVKAIKGFVDRVINLAKEKKLSLLQSNLVDKNLRDRLVKEIIPKLGNRTSGYTSLIKLGTRLGDQTMMVRMSLIGIDRLPVLGSRLSDKSSSVVSKSVKAGKTQTGKQKTGKLESDNRQQKTDNRKSVASKKTTGRSK